MCTRKDSWDWIWGNGVIKFQKKKISERRIWSKINEWRCIERCVSRFSAHAQNSLTSLTCYNLTRWLCRSNIRHYTLNVYIDKQRAYNSAKDSSKRFFQMYAGLTPKSTNHKISCLNIFTSNCAKIHWWPVVIVVEESTEMNKARRLSYNILHTFEQLSFLYLMLNYKLI